MKATSFLVGFLIASCLIWTTQPAFAQFDPSKNQRPNQATPLQPKVKPQDGSEPRVATNTYTPTVPGTNSTTNLAATPSTIESKARTTDAQVESFAPGQTLALVGGYPIFVSDMSVEMSALIKQFLGGAPKHVIDQQRPVLIRKLLPKYVDSKLMYVDVIQNLPKEANLEKIFESASKQFDENVLPIIMEQSGAKSAAEMDALLRAQGSSLRLMRKSWSENELTKFMTREKIETDPEITRKELLDYYQDNRSEFEVVAKAKWEEIMVRFSKFPDKLNAKKAIAEMGNKIVGGANFQAVARKESHGLNAAEGGQYDWTVKGSLVSTELDKAIFDLPLNHLSEIIETKLGFHIIRITERQEAGITPFTEAQPEIRKKLVEQKQEQVFREHLESLRKKIPVEILIEDE